MSKGNWEVIPSSFLSCPCPSAFIRGQPYFTHPAPSGLLIRRDSKNASSSDC